MVNPKSIPVTPIPLNLSGKILYVCPVCHLQTAKLKRCKVCGQAFVLDWWKPKKEVKKM